MGILEVGSKLYIPFTFYTNHEKTYCSQGGLATITKVYRIDNVPEFNRLFVKVKEVSTEYNLKHLLKNQKKWKEKCRNQMAYNDLRYN